MVAAEPSTRGAARLLLFGPPGSGKGTQAGIVAERLGIPAISTGEMLRAAVEAGSELGRRVEAVMLSGNLVDDDTMAEVVAARLARADAREGFILDGYPRTRPQAETLDGILDRQGSRLDAVVLLEVPEEVLVARSLARNRADDSEEVVRERQRVYRNKTAPLVGYYEARGLLRRVDGDRTVEDVTRQVLSQLGRGAA